MQTRGLQPRQEEVPLSVENDKAAALSPLVRVSMPVFFKLMVKAQFSQSWDCTFPICSP